MQTDAMLFRELHDALGVSTMTSAQYAGYRFGSHVLDLERWTILAPDGHDIPLRPKSFALLRLLVENAGRLVSQDTIMKTLWSDVFVTENNISQCIHEIRTVLGPGAQRILRTRPRLGYVFTSEVVPLMAREQFVWRSHRDGDHEDCSALSTIGHHGLTV
jgi:DNA-binding winged helix-turn-helix (wHTH) protein